MKTFSKKIILIPAVLLLTFLCGCAAFFGDPNLSSERAAEAIGKALTAWDATDKQALDVHTELTRPAVITETEDLHLQFTGLRSESPLIAVQESFSCGNAVCTAEEIYADGTVYRKADDALFSGTYKDYVTRLMPIAIPKRDIFNEVTGVRKEDTVVITPVNAADAALWELPDGSSLTAAELHATLTKDSLFRDIAYQVTLQTADGEIKYAVSVTMQADNAFEIQAPQNADAYRSISDLEGLRLLQLASCRLAGAEAIRADITESIDCQAGGVSRAGATELSFSGSGDAFAADVKVKVDQNDYSRSGEISTYEQAEKFIDGKYVLTVGEQEVVPEQEVTADYLKEYCGKLLTDLLPSLNFVSDISSEAADGKIILTVQLGEDAAAAIRENASLLLYQDGALLDSMASFCETDTLTFQMEFSESTGLPMRAKQEYACTHTIENYAYQLLCTEEATYLFGIQQ